MTTIYTHKDGGALACDPPTVRNKNPIEDGHLKCLLHHVNAKECEDFKAYIKTANPTYLPTHFKCTLGHLFYQCPEMWW